MRYRINANNTYTLVPTATEVISNGEVYSFETTAEATFKLLKNGGEFYFSDVYSNRRLSKEIREDKVLHGECLGGALYVNDFIRYAKEAGFSEPRMVTSKEIEIIDEEMKNHEILYVEGAGGLLVPYKDRYTYLDLLVDYRKKSEVIVVSNNSLGTINHTLLTIETLKRNDIMIKGIVFNNKNNDTDEIILRNNIETIEKLSGIKVLKNIEYDGGTGEF